MGKDAHPTVLTMCQKQNNFKFWNNNFPNELNKFLNIMLKHNFFGKNDLILQLNNATLKKIEQDNGFKAYVFDIKQNLFDDKNISTPAINMIVFSKSHYETEFLLHWTKNIKELEIYNVAGENYLELENFDNIEFLSS